MATKTDTTFPTRNDLPDEVRDRMVELLNARLADALDLYTQAKQAHWNVKGPDFAQLHELYDDIAAAVLPFVDEIAERATALGGLALGTARMAAGATSLDEYPTGATDGRATLEVVSDRLAAFAAAARAAIDAAEEAGDMATSDLFVEITRVVDKQLWFVEAHLVD